MERKCRNCKWFKLSWWVEPGDYSEEEMKNEDTAPLGDCYYPYERLPFYLLKGLATREGVSVYPFEGTDCYTFESKEK